MKNGDEKKIKEGFTLSPEIKKKLEEISYKNNFSKSEVVEYLLRKGLKLPIGNCKNSLSKLFQ